MLERIHIRLVWSLGLWHQLFISVRFWLMIGVGLTQFQLIQVESRCAYEMLLFMFLYSCRASVVVWIAGCGDHLKWLSNLWCSHVSADSNFINLNYTSVIVVSSFWTIHIVAEFFLVSISVSTGSWYRKKFRFSVTKINPWSNITMLKFWIQSVSRLQLMPKLKDFYVQLFFKMTSDTTH